jgi:homoaconitase/3-isopropylmalate dehydratase large subunit
MQTEFRQVFRKDYGSKIGKDMENNVRTDLLERWFVRMGSGWNGSGCGQCLAFVKHLWFTLTQHRILSHSN